MIGAIVPGHCTFFYRLTTICKQYKLRARAQYSRRFCAQPKNYLLINAALFLPNGQSSGTQNKVTDTHGFFLLNICNITHDDVDQSVFHQRKKDENLKLEIASKGFKIIVYSIKLFISQDDPLWEFHSKNFEKTMDLYIGMYFMLTNKWHSYFLCKFLVLTVHPDMKTSMALM